VYKLLENMPMPWEQVITTSNNTVGLEQYRLNIFLERDSHYYDQ
jgi:hypothetical protein